MSPPVQYHCQENQRRTSRSGATTAARTAAAIRPARAWRGSAWLPLEAGWAWSQRDQLAGMRVPFTGGDLQRAGEDRTAAFHRGAQRVQLLSVESQLCAQVLDAGGPGVSEMVEQPPPTRVGGAHAGDLGPADRVDQVCHLASHQQVLAPVHRGDEIAAVAELAEPRPLGRGPGREPWGCPACTGPRGRPHTGWAARNRRCGSTAHGRAGMPPPRRECPTPDRESDGSRTPAAPAAW
jgi:hypothetical protein